MYCIGSYDATWALCNLDDRSTLLLKQVCEMSFCVEINSRNVSATMYLESLSLSLKFKDKDSSPKDKDTDLSHKDKDLSRKDKDKDKDSSLKDKDKDLIMCP